MKFRLTTVLFLWYMFQLVQILGCIEILVRNISDSVGSVENCYPVSTDFCNLRSAWIACTSLCAAVPSTISICSIGLPPHSRLYMDVSLGPLKLSRNNSISLEGNEAVLESHSKRNVAPTYSLFYYDDFHNTSESNETTSYQPYLMINNLSFIGFHSSNGGAVYIDGNCRLILTSIYFQYNTALNSGGAVYVDRNLHSTTIANCSFMNCSSFHDGGSVYIGSMNMHVNIANNLFLSSVANNGGGIYVDSSNEGTVIQANQFRNCTSSFNGGAIFINQYNTDFSIHNNEFHDCNTSSKGGGVAVNANNNDITFADNYFISCKSAYGGGLYFGMNNTDIDIFYNQFTSCIALSSGGGIYFNNDNHNVTIRNSSFEHCSGYLSGSAIALEIQNSYFEVSSCTMVKCLVQQPGTYPSISDYAGGAIFLNKYNSYIVISRCYFTKIISFTYGAIACMAYNSFVKISDNIFTDISLQYVLDETTGSAIFFKISNHNLDIIGNDFVDCYAMFATLLFDHYNSDIVIQQNVFIDCTSLYGPAITININSYAIKITDNAFVNCTAVGGFSGAVVILDYNYDILLENLYFSECHSIQIGGGLYIDNNNENIIINNVTFDSCSAGDDGGSIYINGNNKYILINNTKIVNSHSINFGGAMVIGLKNTNINISYCSFINNYSNKGGALYLDNGNTNIFLIGNLFQDNTAEADGGGCYFNKGNDNILFIDEDTCQAIVVYDNNIPSGTREFTRTFNDEISVIILKFDSTTTENTFIDMKLDSKAVYQDLLTSSNTFPGVATPSTLLATGKLDISMFSRFDDPIVVKFYLIPVIKRVQGRKNIFSNNIAKEGNGGAIFYNINNNFATLINANFIQNSAINGGALYFGPLNPGSIFSNNLFQNNNCSQNGGAIYFLTYNSGVQLYNDTFQSNLALMYGGAIHLELQNGIKFYAALHNAVNIISSTFMYNSAVLYGGVLYSAQENIIIIKNSQIIGNQAVQGGGFFATGSSNISFVGVNNISMNHATLGGGMFLFESYLYTNIQYGFVNLLNMNGNFAERGSAIYLDSIYLINDKSIQLTNARFNFNNATVGGTVYWIYDSVSKAGMKKGPQISDMLFVSNYAKYGTTIATQGLTILGPNQYEVSVYSSPVVPFITVTVYDFYGQIIHGAVVVTPTIIDNTNKTQCLQQNPYLSGHNVVGLIENNGRFIFSSLEMYCYPKHKFNVQFETNLMLSEISNSREYLNKVSTVVLASFRACAMGETIVDGNCRSCPNGTYSLVSNVQASTTCVDCTQTNGVLRCNSKNIEIQSKYWRRHDHSTTVLHCLSYLDGCNGGYKTGDESCKYGYTGPLCATCIDGFYNDGIQCIPCSNPNRSFTIAAIMYLCLATLLVGLLIAYFISKYTFKYDILKYTKKSLKSLYSKTFFRLRIIIATYQVVGAIQYALIVKFPYLFSELSVIVSTLFFDISSLLPFHCRYTSYNFVDKMILWTTMPIILVLLLVVIATIEYKYRIRHSVEKNQQDSTFNGVRDKYLFYFFVLTYLILPSVTTSLFRMFVCTNVDPNKEDPSEYNYYLDADVRIPCYTTYWYRSAIYSCLLIIVYPVGIPMMYLWILSLVKKELVNRPSDREIELLEESRLRHRYEKTNIHADEVSALSNQALCLKMLWEPYKNEYWYWEVIECYRRIVLTSIVSIISPGSALQSVVAVLFSVFFIRLYTYFSPYSAYSDNILAELGQLQVFITFFIALTINNSLLVGRKWSETLDIILIGSNFCIALVGMYYTIESITLLRKLSPTDHADDDNERFISFEATNDPDLLYNSSKMNQETMDQLIISLETDSSSNQRGDVYNFELEDIPDPPFTSTDEEFSSGSFSPSCIQSDVTQSVRFNTPYIRSNS